MSRFANMGMLWLLSLIPLILIVYFYVVRRKRNQLKLFGDNSLIADLMPNVSRIRPTVKLLICLFSLTLLIIAVARPQFGQKEKKVKRQGIEAMIALDISNSMLTEDVVPNRLDKAKQMLSKMIDQMIDDKIGLVVFAGEAFTQIPITCDYVSAKMFLNNINPSLIKTQGTAIGDAIATCMQAFGSEEREAGRAIILITDGENHQDDAVAMAKKAKEAGISIFVIGIGKTEGAPIPIPGTNNYMKDRAGNVVVSRLNENMCKEVAYAANGTYVHCDNSNTAMKALQKELERVSKGDIETTMYTDFNEQYQSFTIIAFLLLVIEFFIFARKNKSLSKINLFRGYLYENKYNNKK